MILALVEVEKNIKNAVERINNSDLYDGSLLYYVLRLHLLVSTAVEHGFSTAVACSGNDALSVWVEKEPLG